MSAGSDAHGVAFNYSNYDAMLLGLILERATHRSVAQYLQEKIWQPLGMEYPASWSLDSTQSGFEKMAMGLNARAWTALTSAQPEAASWSINRSRCGAGFLRWGNNLYMSLHRIT